MSKYYTPTSNALIQHYYKHDLTRDEAFFLIQLLSYDRGQILNDGLLGIDKKKARTIRQSLKEKGFITYFSLRGTGTQYFINIEKLKQISGVADIQKKEVKEAPKRQEAERPKDNRERFTPEQREHIEKVFEDKGLGKEYTLDYVLSLNTGILNRMFFSRLPELALKEENQ